MKIKNLPQLPKSMLYKGLAACMLAAAVAMPFAAYAKPAYPGIIEHVMPDGSILPVRIMGDEFAHRIFTADGYLLSQNENGEFFYATLDEQGLIQASSVKAVAPEKRSASDNSFLANIDTERIKQVATAADNEVRGIRKSTLQKKGMQRKPNSLGFDMLKSSFPSFGSPKVLVILVEYKDVKFTTNDAHTYFSEFLNKPDFDRNGATGSALDYFIDNSHGKFTPDFELIGPITLPERMKYYGGNTSYGTDAHPEEMVLHALEILDPEVDFSVYDTNADGYIDNVYLIYAGKGEADMGGADTVWPHSWEIEDGTGKTHIYDGVRLNRYACSNEIDNTTRRPDGIGTFVHEFSHVMGLPDIYATDYTGSFTPGSWCALDYGPYNNSGRTPPNYGMYEKYSLGWVEPKRFSGEATAQYTIFPTTEDDGYLVETERPYEFFLLDVRNRIGWDEYIPGEGMLVWYIDYNKDAWEFNTVNNDPYRQRVDIIEADGRPTEATRDGDCFPGSANVTQFTADTYPAFTCRLNKPVNVELTNIHRNANGSVSFTATHNVKEWDSVNNVKYDGDSWTLNGNMLYASAGVTVFTPAGVRVATLAAGQSAEIPAGMYIIHSGNNASKVMVK